METFTANDYLPVDLLGIGSMPLALFCAAAAVIVLGFVVSSLMAFHFKTGMAKAIVVLNVALIAAGVAGWFAFDGYQKTAAENLASNVSQKYPELKLMSPDAVIKDYVLLQDSEDNSPLEVTVTQGDETFKYRIDTSKGKSEPTLTPVENGDAPNPINFLRPAGATE